MALNAPGDQTYTMGQTITDLTLPAATGGTGTLTYTLRDGTGNDVDTTDNAVPGLTFDGRPPRPVRHADHGGDHGPDLHRHRRARQHRFGYRNPHRGNRVALNAPGDQTYTMGPITALTLPAATGGTGTLTYTLTGPSDAALSQAVPGLTFTTTTRVLTGTPTTTATTALIYTVTDDAVAPPRIPLTSPWQPAWR